MIKALKIEIKKLKTIFKNPTFIFLTLGGNSVLLLCCALLYFLEKDINPQIKTFFDALWWGICTITTVSYGDIVPVTFWGRCVGILLIYTGTVLFVTFTGVVLFLLTKDELKSEIRPLEKELKREEKEQVQFEKALLHIQNEIEEIKKSRG